MRFDNLTAKDTLQIDARVPLHILSSLCAGAEKPQLNDRDVVFCHAQLVEVLMQQRNRSSYIMGFCWPSYRFPRVLSYAVPIP
jgi:hypothetical protein